MVLVKIHPGRTPLLDEDPGVGRVFLAVIAVGGKLTTACKTAGISRTTFYNWKKKAEEGVEPYVSFMDEYEKAQEAAKYKYLECINKAAEEDWRAAAWGLSRLYPDEFGDRVTNQIEVSQKPDLSKLSDEELERWRELMEKTRG